MDNFFCAPVLAYIIISLIFMCSTCMLVTFPVNMTEVSSQFLTTTFCVLILGLICKFFTDKIWIVRSIVWILAVGYLFSFISMLYNYFYPSTTPVADIVVSTIDIKVPTKTETESIPVPQEEQPIKEPIGMEEQVIKNGEHFAPF